MENSFWLILGVISIILLIIYWRGPNAIWGGLTIGVIIGFIYALFSRMRIGYLGLDWSIIGKGAIVGTLIGFAAELLGVIGTKLFKR